MLPLGGLAVFGMIAATMAATTTAWAAPRGPKAPRAKAAPAPVKPLPAAELETLGLQLGAEDLAVALAAVKRLGESGAPNAAGPLVQALAVGTSPVVATEAIGALQKLKDPAAVSVLALYAGNRNVPVRLAAVKALGATPDERVVPTLIERLGDSAAEIRTACAEALAGRKEARAERRLFALVARNDLGAAGPLGRLVAPNDIPRVAELFGRVDGPVLALVFGEFVKREDVPDRLRLDVVRTLARIPGPVATTAMVEYLATIPENDNRPSKDEVQKILAQRGQP